MSPARQLWPIFFTDRRQKRTSMEVIEISRLACMKKATQRIRLELKAKPYDCTTLRLVKKSRPLTPKV